MGRGEGGRINRRNVRQFSIPLLTFSNTQGVMKMRKRVTFIDGRSCQCYIWNLLGHRSCHLRYIVPNIP